MICIPAEIPNELCAKDDELKSIYHIKDSVCIWILKTREERNRFMYATAGINQLGRRIMRNVC
ncbi:MAG: hypothetical protein CMC82_08645 [Flavobacteriaceae bacterium]|nr:hypothetical protein [Flavobacteriaceae bacterium]